MGHVLGADFTDNLLQVTYVTECNDQPVEAFLLHTVCVWGLKVYELNSRQVGKLLLYDWPIEFGRLRDGTKRRTSGKRRIRGV